MTVLTKRETWRSTTALARVGERADLTAGEAAHARLALRFLRTRAGSGAKLAAGLRVLPSLLRAVLGPKGRAPSASLALRASRLAGVPLEDVLSGVWPGDRCPHCGRG